MTSKRVVFLFAVSILAAGVATANGDVIQYDSGALGSSFSGLWGGAVRFTNPESFTITVTKLTIRGGSMISGSLDVYLWASDSGSPGSQLASLTSQTLGNTWTSYDFSSSNITVGAGGDVFGGLHCGTADMPYDNDATTTNRSWYKYGSSSSWTQGEFGSGADHDLMVRLEYAPEPCGIVLLGIGAFGLLGKRRLR